MGKPQSTLRTNDNKPAKMISVIIPTCDRNELLGNCLLRLSHAYQSIAENEYEVVVSDDSKENIARDFIAHNYKWVKWIEGPKKGPAANRNNGAKYAMGDWFIFIDDDCIPDRNLLYAYQKGIETYPNISVFEGSIYPDSWKLLKCDMAECPVNTTGGCFWSANICIEKTLFKKVGGFNEKLIIAAQEDQQLKLDIERSMNTIFFLKNAKVVHPVRIVSLRKKLSRIHVASKNFCIYANTNRQLLGYTSASRFLKSQIKVHVRQAFVYLKAKKGKSFINELAWICWGIPLNLYHYCCSHKAVKKLEN